ncbi:unnamed protein product, partial [Iphiclides podalirius]
MQVVVCTVEMVQSYYFFWDDYEDGAKTRQGKPCWHLVDHIGSLAFNDACLMRSFIEEIVRQNFEDRLRDQILNIYNKNDLIDYFHVNGFVSGKSGTDIQEGKCSWVAVAALQKCNPGQRRIFTENYGSKEPEKVERILRLYEELNIQQLYAQEEKARYDAFHKQVSPCWDVRDDTIRHRLVQEKAHWTSSAQRKKHVDSLLVKILGDYNNYVPKIVDKSLANAYFIDSTEMKDRIKKNDLIDYFLAKGTVSGKSGTDIQEGKCSWPAVAVLQKCSPEQRRIFTENYGSKEPEKVERILRLYEEFNIQQLYAQEEKARYDIFHKKVSELPKDAIPSAEFFKDFYTVIRQYTEDTKTLMYVKF